MTLSKTQKKGKEHKESLVKKLRESVEQYKSLYIFSYENMRNSKFKEFKDNLKSSSRSSTVFNISNLMGGVH